MIKSISMSGRYVIVNGGMPPATYLNTSSGGMNVGDVRFNIQHQNLEVYDGYNWQCISMGHVSVGLTADAEATLDWASRQMMKEYRLTELAKTNTVINDLVNQKKDIDDKIAMVQTLMKEEIKVGTN